ncbi:glycosyltransferase family 2 protein [Virgibacillus ainsalahensis]
MDYQENELNRLDKVLKEKEVEKEQSLRKRKEMQREFDSVQAKLQKASNVPKKAKQFIWATGAYALGRRNRKQLYSKVYKRKNAANQLKKYMYHLYDLGFTKKALEDLEHLYEETNDRYVKKAIAWELSLWYANKYTKDGARQALEYLPVTIRGEKDEDFLRKAVIISAECLERLGKADIGKQLLEGRISARAHPDLYLALANLEESLERRVEWINKALEMYGIAPIVFTGNTYEDLSTLPINRTVEDGPKVSVILPAYKAANGIRVAIESILNQTWKNIELLVVDDCSPDDTVKVVKEYIEKDARIRILSTPVNSGPYVARNIALKEAKGEYVTINDADDWSHAEKIETQVRHLMENKTVIANTSEHARLTEELKLHRRGTPGAYIFSNMSSLMFRRIPVLDTIGFWDTVRFAADSEFKKRMATVFGSESIVDLRSGPLSLPRQASGSLTGSSAFGYSGFLMGVRKEYAEVHRLHQQEADSLYYPFPQVVRPYPVPEPMWTKREDKPDGSRHFDVVIVSDFRLPEEKHQDTLEEIRINKEKGLRTGLVQMAHYDFTMSKNIDRSIRDCIDGKDVQMLVYGENITSDVLLIKHPAVFEEKQKYVPAVHARVVRGVIGEVPANMRQCVRNAAEYADKQVKWYPKNDIIRSSVNTQHIKLSPENWSNYEKRLEDWII